jgi:hypothetical protein
MFQRIRNGWELMKASAHALAADRELLVFPLASGVATLIITASFLVPLFLTGAWREVSDESTTRVAGVAVAWLFYFVLSAATVYFNTALVGAALIRLQGGDPTLGDGLRIASSRLRSILGYAAIAATVGLVLKMIANRGGALQRWVASLFGVAWSLATYLVVPVLAASGVGPVDAIKQSASLFKRTWGEQVAGSGGIKLISGLVTVALILLAVPLFILAASAESVALLGALAGFFVLLFVALALVTSALQGVYSAALYRFATSGEASFGFEAGLLQGAFQPRR